MSRYLNIIALVLLLLVINTSNGFHLKNKIKQAVTILLQQTPNDWTFCANENENCNSSGVRMIRYGNNGQFAYREANGPIACNNNMFGDPIRGTQKFCHFKNIPYQWVYCGEENQTCNFTGSSIVRYGVDSSFAYRAATNSMGCSHSIFGDPRWGKKKFCHYLLENDWTTCASHGGRCTFKGTKILRYGSGLNNYQYTEANTEIHCSNTSFRSGNANHGFLCQIKTSAYFWVQCAKENSPCKFTGTTVVRYGNNNTWVYRLATTEIGCNNATFGDPLYGVQKICEYVASTDNDLAPALKESTDSKLSEPEPESAAVQKATCSQDAGFGFPGSCLSQLYGNAVQQTALPQGVKTTLDFASQILYNIGYAIDVCAGDYKGDAMASNNKLKFTKCDSIPFMEEFNYGVIGAYASNVLCGATPQNINFCAAFDRCGSVAVSLNAGILQCAATYSTGLAAILSPISGTLDFISFGISPKRRFTQKLKIAYREGERIETKEIDTYGHFMISAGLSFPIKFKLGGKSFDEIFSLDISATYMIDFGSADRVVSDLINNVVSFSRPQNQSIQGAKNAAMSVLNSIINSGAEMTLQIKGSFSINFNDLTRGFLPNLEFEIGEGNILVNTGTKSASGMRPGVYIHFSHNATKSLLSIFNKIMSQFSSVLSVFGIPSFSLPSINTSIGVFVQDDSAGFEFYGLGMSLRCMFIYSKGSGSCNFNHKFFTAIIEGAKWVIKHAKKFFDNAGKEVMRFGNEAGKFAKNAADATAGFFTGDVRNFFERDVGGAFKGAAGDVKDFFEGDVKNTFRNAGNAIVNFVSKW